MNRKRCSHCRWERAGHKLKIRQARYWQKKELKKELNNLYSYVGLVNKKFYGKY